MGESVTRLRNATCQYPKVAYVQLTGLDHSKLENFTYIQFLKLEVSIVINIGVIFIVPDEKTGVLELK